MNIDVIVTAARALAATCAIAAAALASIAIAGHQHAAPAPASAAICRFDGGGTLPATQGARTSDGHLWTCTEDGVLKRIR